MNICIAASFKSSIGTFVCAATTASYWAVDRTSSAFKNSSCVATSRHNWRENDSAGQHDALLSNLLLLAVKHGRFESLEMKTHERDALRRKRKRRRRGKRGEGVVEVK